MTREEAINKLNRALDNNTIEDVQDAYDYITAIKMAIEALEQEPKTGHWIYTLEDWNKWECSECGFTKRTDVHISIGYNYCPNCGAKMIKKVRRAGTGIKNS